MTSSAAPGIRGAARGRGPAGASRLVRRLAGDLAEERVFRVLAFGFLPAAVVFGLLAAPSVAAQHGSFPLWWNQAAFCTLILPCVLLGALAFTAPIRVLRALAAFAAVATLLAQATMPLVVTSPVPRGDAPWFDQIIALGTIAPVLAVSARAAVLDVLAAGVLTFVDRVATSPGNGALVGVQNGLYVVLFSITFVALGASSVAAARAADDAEADVLRAATQAAADAARERERARINALVHDQVLATLLTAARGIPDSATHERDDARRALEGLHALLREDDTGSAALTGEELAWKVQAVTTDLAPEATFGYDVTMQLAVPADAAEALLGAAEEALRNSVRHSAAVNRTVHVGVDVDGVRIDVLDDGSGFDRRQVRPTSLGIAESIERRMRQVPGGSAAVVSQAGVGTRVRLHWRAG